MYQKDFHNTGNLNEFAVWAADFIDNLPVGLYRTTLEGELLFCNWMFANILGYNRPDMLQDFKVVEMFPYKEERGQFIQEVLEHGMVERFSMELLKRNGETFLCNTTAKAVANEDGLVIYIDGVMTEAGSTRQTRQETHLLHSSSDVQSLHFCLNSEGKFLELNEPAKEILGKDLPLQARESSIYDFIQQSYRLKLDTMLESVLKGEVVDDILTVRDKQGQARQIACQASLRSSQQGEHCIEVVGRDVTTAIEGLKKRQTEVKLQGVLEMAGGIAHNMNQPLMIINNLLRDILSDIGGEQKEIQEKLSRIVYQVEKLNTIAEKVRSVKQYKSMHYLLGEKIVDLENMSSE